MKTKTKQQDSIKNKKENENTFNWIFFIHNAWERESPNNGFQEVRHIYCKFQHCVILTLVVTFHLASGK